MLIKMEDLISNLSLETSLVEMGNVFSDLLIPVGYETSKYGYAPSRPADLMDGPLIARIRGRSRRYMRLAHVRSDCLR